MSLLGVLLGGAIGSVLRYGIGRVIPLTPNGFPWATFWVNSIGCLGIGLLAGYLEKRAGNSDALRLFWMTGICGGFTTFSAFSLETLNLLQQQRWPLAIAYVAGSVGIGILATWAGWQWLRA